MPENAAVDRDQEGLFPPLASSMEGGLNETIRRHYSVSELATRILEALEKAGKDPSRLSVGDLAPIDEFHIRGRQATLELAEAAGIQSHHTVLDVGSGIGGPARCLASEFGCRVTGLDLTEEYCRTANLLSDRVGLSGLVRFEQGDALSMAFPGESFDVVWTEHVAMNIRDKPMLYREMERVLKPGGTLAIYDVCSGEGGPVHFPVPWARSADASFLASPEQLRRLVNDAGFRITDWRDTSARAREWFVALAERVRREGAPLLSWGMLMGDDFPTMAQNQRRNLEEGRIALVQLVARKQPT
jgi:SAM-dependent methyltransferase